uniref:Competence protein ComEA n=1 Tax=Candidatus Kentrum sp. SD TaxID=2126332 RepID=A0A450YDE2_9GAMM|nr:MAG: competence protein ComEA [Candidatus Kentron sp. SD]VFK39549.1 MAG: competence protein ComEA [Candidatus Kentron sp. SD]VFK79339.1 MAG: competence protein ComEA [Candidatus Kentron sp. SD]
MKIVKRLLFVFLLVTWGLLSAGEPVDINTATKDELMTINGIGPVIADRIVAERSAGVFCSLEELATRVKGVGKKIIETQSGNLTLGDIKKPCAANHEKT